MKIEKRKVYDITPKRKTYILTGRWKAKYYNEGSSEEWHDKGWVFTPENGNLEQIIYNSDLDKHDFKEVKCFRR